MAGYLGLNGRRVRVHDVRPEAVGGIRERGGLDVSGIASGFAPIECATTSLAEAVEGAALIAVTTVNNDHDAVATALAPLLRDGQIVCLIPGYVGGALQFRHQLDRLGCAARVKLGEMDNFPFTGAIEGPAAVRVASLKRQLQVAALPASEALPWSRPCARSCPRRRRRRRLPDVARHDEPVLHVPGMLGDQGRLRRR